MNDGEKRSKIERLKELVSQVKSRGGHSVEKWNEMVDLAFELHKQVKPKHHKYMYENRGVSPDTREFYDHTDPVEDLIAFVENPTANDDPIDQTINEEFKFSVFTRRWDHNDIYKIKRTEIGWFIDHVSIGGECDKSGHPYLYKNFTQDNINYPKFLPGYFEWLWYRAKEDGLSKDDVQAALNQLAEWVSNCERQSPKGVFQSYK